MPANTKIAVNAARSMSGSGATAGRSVVQQRVFVSLHDFKRPEE
jgi:hypothetical protein